MAILDRLPPQWRFRILKRLKGGTAAARALGVTVGERCRIISCSVRSEYDLLTIGDRVTVSSDVVFITHDGTGWLFCDDRGRRYNVTRITVGSDVFIGSGALIMGGVRIGARSIVAAGSVVTKSVPTGAIVGGNPAQIIGSFDELRSRALATWTTDHTPISDAKPDLEWPEFLSRSAEQSKN